MTNLATLAVRLSGFSRTNDAPWLLDQGDSVRTNQARVWVSRGGSGTAQSRIRRGQLGISAPSSSHHWYAFESCYPRAIPALPRMNDVIGKRAEVFERERLTEQHRIELIEARD